MNLSIVIPAYNEAECIATVLNDWLRVAEAVDGNVVVVNDGSRDGTGEILDFIAQNSPRLKVIHQANQGHGVAVMRGYQEALSMKPKFIFQTDSDNQFRSEDFYKFWEQREKSNFILGIRKNRQDPLHRLLISQTMRMLNMILMGASIRDANVPFRLMKTAHFENLLSLMPEGVFAPNIFLSILAKKCGNNILEIPVTHQERETGVVSIIRWKLVRVCLRSLRELVTFRFQLMSSQIKDRSAPGLYPH